MSVWIIGVLCAVGGFIAGVVALWLVVRYALNEAIGRGIGW